MKPINFTPEEKQQLAEAITLAARGIAQCWDVLSAIGDRIGKDWEPTGTSVSDIADLNASDIDDPANCIAFDADTIAEQFNDPENWVRP